MLHLSLTGEPSHGKWDRPIGRWVGLQPLVPFSLSPSPATRRFVASFLFRLGLWHCGLVGLHRPLAAWPTFLALGLGLLQPLPLPVSYDRSIERFLYGKRLFAATLLSTCQKPVACLDLPT